MLKFLAALLCLIGVIQVVPTAASKRVVCYWGSWSVYRWGDGLLRPDLIDPNLCTHIIYTFAGIDDRSFQIKSLDPWNDLGPGEPGGGNNNYRNLVNLKSRNSALKVLLAVGGWNEGGYKYSQMASNPSTRNTFIESVVNHLNRFGFDGLELDWEYPNLGDRNNHAALVKELRSRFSSSGLLLGVAVPATQDRINSYDLPTIAANADFLNILSYDYHTDYSQINHNSPLYSKIPTDTLTVDYTAKLYKNSGVPMDKLNLGLLLYAHAYRLSSSSQTNIGDPASGPGAAGSFTQQAGILAYFEFCRRLSTDAVIRDPVMKVPTTNNGYELVAYEDSISLSEKVQYAKNEGFGGVMVWSLENDDNHRVCGDSLTKTIHDQMS